MSIAKDFYNQATVGMAISYREHPAFASTSPFSTPYDDMAIRPVPQAPYDPASYSAYQATSTQFEHRLSYSASPLPPPAPSTSTASRSLASTTLPAHPIRGRRAPADTALPEYRAPESRPPTQHIISAGSGLDLLIRTSTTTESYLSVTIGADPPLVLRAGPSPSPSAPIIAALRFGKFPDGTLCLGDPYRSAYPAEPARWSPWSRELGFKSITFTIPGPRGDGQGERRLRWEKSRSRRHGLGTLGRTKGWLLKNLDTEEVLASFRSGGGDRVGETRWFADVTADEEIGATIVLVGMWFRMRQLEVGGDYESWGREGAAGRGSGESGRSSALGMRGRFS